MELKIIAVYDRKLEAHMRPIFTPTLGAGIRSFQDELNRKESELHAHPEDYELRELGTWNDQTGRFINTPEIKAIAFGDQLIRE